MIRTRAPRSPAGVEAGAGPESHTAAEAGAGAESNAAAAPLRRERDPDLVAAYLQDAARYPGGHALEVCFPESEADVAALLAEGRPLLVVGAQSSLTGGATPHGEVVVSTSRMKTIRDWTTVSVRCGPGVVLSELIEASAARDLYFPPVPTYDGATVGGVVSTDAAGAATFKHGTVRSWVEGLTVVLACGEVLDLERGRVLAHREGWFGVEKLDGEVLRVPIPRPARPSVPKVSAGYRGGDGMDLVDLFVGSEGTLGVITEVRLRLVGPCPQWLTVLVAVTGDDEAVSLTRELRDEAERTRREHDAGGIDVSAIEYMDARCLEVLREDGAPQRLGVPLPDHARALLLVQVELAADYDRARAFEELAACAEESTKGPVAALCRILERRGLLAAAAAALPGEEDRRRAFFALREAVPEGVNARVRERQRTVDASISKSGGDVIVPFERFAESLVRYRALIAEAGIDAAIWGHISDGNVHPNLLARSADEMEKARAVQTAIGLAAIELGGSPLAEHGTGRNVAKKGLLTALHGEAGVASMLATKRVLDPGCLLAPGVLFDPDTSGSITQEGARGTAS